MWKREQGRREMRWRNLGQDTGKQGRVHDTGFQRWMWAPTLEGWGMQCPDPLVVHSSQSETCQKPP